MVYSDEYDFNRRTRKAAPAGVGRGRRSADRETKHTVTVGDLCFVALGQIVNRRFSASRYQPSGGVVVNSPTESAALRKVIVEDWNTLSAESHKRLLIEDFLKPDHEERRTGAYSALAFYYPETVEELVLKELSTPTFDVFIIEKFCRENLYLIEKKEDRKTAYESFLSKHGEAFASGVSNQLFDDLNYENRFGSQPRELLVQLFGQPADVVRTDQPVMEVASDGERARFIRTLIHDDSRRISEAVKDVFLKNMNDTYFAAACLSSLASRGYADFVIEQLARIDPADTEAKRLHIGYLDAVATSKSPAVRAKLFDILKRSGNERYFMAALPAVDRSEDKAILDAAVKLLAKFPADSKSGGWILPMIGERFPNEAKTVFQSFLAPGSANRAGTMCKVLLHAHPLSKELLAPLLDDKRELTGFTIRMRVCDRAAEAISYTSKDKNSALIPSGAWRKRISRSKNSSSTARETFGDLTVLGKKLAICRGGGTQQTFWRDGPSRVIKAIVVIS